jgi:hypothetical protein
MQHNFTAEKLANFKRCVVRPPGSRTVLINEASFLKWTRGEEVTGQEEGRLIPVHRWTEFHVWPPLAGMRWLIFKSSSPETLSTAMKPRCKVARTPAAPPPEAA